MKELVASIICFSFLGWILGMCEMDMGTWKFWFIISVSIIVWNLTVRRSFKNPKN